MSPAKPKLADPGVLIREGKLRTDTFRACMDPDLIAEHEALVARRDAAKEASRDSLAGGSVVELDGQIAEVLDQIEKVTLVLTLRAMPRPEFRALIAKHPPRKDGDGNFAYPQDARLGVNYDTCMAALVRLSIVDPDLDATTLDLLLDERLTDADYNALTTVAWNLNMGSVSVPFWPASSPSRRTSSPR